MIQWKEDFSIGVPSIDEQHKKLLEITGRAYSLLKDEMRLDKYDQIVEILAELKDYTIYHFKFEEEYMASIGYGKLLSHKVEHADFIDKVNAIDMDKIDNNQNQYLLGLLDFVVDWIANHILQKDKLIPAGK